MEIAIFWLDVDNQPQVKNLGKDALSEALTYANTLRNDGLRHVVISTDFSDSVGKRGVSDVLPEGYDWKKRR